MDRKEQKILLKKAIIQFEKTAKELIQLLSNSFDLDLSHSNPFERLIIRQNNLWKGKLDKNWKYQFHGDACKFENMVTEQIVDIKINRRENWGAITNFYLLKFIETTDSLKHVFQLINSEKQIMNLLEEMQKERILINIGEQNFRTLILNKAHANQ